MSPVTLSAADSVPDDGVWLNVRDFGAVGDGKTDDTAAVQRALEAAYEADNGALLFPAGTYIISKTVELKNTSTCHRAFPSLIGVQQASPSTGKPPGKPGPDSIQTGSTLKFVGDSGPCLRLRGVAVEGAGFFTGGVIRDLCILGRKRKDSNPTIGLELIYCLEYRLYNVGVRCFNIGFHNDHGWSWDAFGLTVIHNRIGILLDTHSNACGIFGLQGHQNDIGVKIRHGGNILIDRATLEGCRYSVVICSDGKRRPWNVALRNIYTEHNYQGVVLVGRDENGKEIESGPITGIVIDNLNYSGKTFPMIQLHHCRSVRIENSPLGHMELVRIGEDVADVSIVNSTHYSNSYLATADADVRGLAVRCPYSVIPNGYFNHPSVDMWRAVPAAKNLKWSRAVDPKGHGRLRATLKPGAKAGTRFGVWVANDPRLRGRLHLSANVASFSGFDGLAIGAWTPEGKTIAGNGAAKGVNLVNFSIPEEADRVLVGFEMGGVAGEKAASLLLNSFILTPQREQMVQPGVVDYLSGYSGLVTTRNGQATVTVPDGRADLYEIVLTPYFGDTVYATRTDGGFVVTTNGGGDGTVSYLLIPKAGMLP